MNFGFIIDNRKCIGCHACTVACKSEHDVPIGVNRTWVKYIEKGQYPNTRRLFSVMRCNHCEDAPCVDICPTQALYTREDGIVDFDNRRCIGCKSCMQACPYDALYIDPETHTAAKCNYCSHRTDIGLEPACVNVCPEHAIISGDMDNPNSEISQLLATEQVTARKIEKGTKPKLYYIDGDDAALNPTSAPASESYLWNSQQGGVGHFAKYAESLLASRNPVEMVKQLDQKSTVESTPIVPKEPRRVYDAPNKGLLWGWEVSAYVLTKAISAGMFLLPFIAGFFYPGFLEGPIFTFGIGLSLIFLIITGGLLVKDLDKPSRFAYVLLRPQWSSWLTRGGYIITVFGGLLLAVLLTFRTAPDISRIFQWSAAIFAVLTAVYTAFLFAQAKGRDFWQSPALPLHMLVHPFLAGAALFLIISYPLAILVGSSLWRSFLVDVLLFSLIANIIILAAELFTSHPTKDAELTAKYIVAGPFRNAFWMVAVIIGNLLPIGLLLFSALPLWIPAAMALIGLYVTENIWVKAPQLVPLS
ncbi:MAG: 4Fe-4S dicluster domain-containing protein [Calditrichota bacterium]